MNQLKIFLFFVFIPCCQSIQAKDTHQLDSLLQQLNENSIDTLQLKINRAIGDYYMYSNTKKAIEYFEKAKTIASNLKRSLDIAGNLYSIGFCYRNSGIFDKALDNYLLSTVIYEGLNDKRRLANAYLSIVAVYADFKNIAKANEYYQKAEAIILSRNDSSQLCSMFSQKANIYFANGQYDSSLVYLKKQYQIQSLLNDQEANVGLLGNIGIMYKKIHNTEQALLYTQQALALLNTQQYMDDFYTNIYNNLGSIYVQAGKYLEAKKAFDKSIMYSKQIGLASMEMENFHNLADMYGIMKNYKLQVEYLQKYHSIKDSLFTTDTKNKLTELESDYKLGKKNIELVKKDADIKQQMNERNIFIIIAIASLLVLSTLYYFYSKLKKKKILLEGFNIKINSQKNELEHLNQIKDRLFGIISHDIRNPLVTLRSYLMLSDNANLSPEHKLLFKNQTINAVTQTSEMLDNLLAWANLQIKNTNVSLVPIHLKDCVMDVLTLTEQQALQKNITIIEQVDDMVIPSDFDILTIAIRNLITNAIKFSYEHGSIFIQTHRMENYILLSIQDQGVGISDQQIEEIMTNKINTSNGTNGEKGSGLGLFLVKSLLHKINAALIIENPQGKGSIFTIRLNTMQ